MSNYEEAYQSQDYLDMVGLMIDDQWRVLADTSVEHDRRVRAFLMLSMAMSMTPESYYVPAASRLQERLQQLPPIDIVNTIHVLADAMGKMLALGFGPPPGFGGMG